MAAWNSRNYSWSLHNLGKSNSKPRWKCIPNDSFRIFHQSESQPSADIMIICQLNKDQGKIESFIFQECQPRTDIHFPSVVHDESYFNEYIYDGTGGKAIKMCSSYSILRFANIAILVHYLSLFSSVSIWDVERGRESMCIDLTKHCSSHPDHYEETHIVSIDY